jgi:hypothetical protein
MDIAAVRILRSRESTTGTLLVEALIIETPTQCEFLLETLHTLLLSTLIFKLIISLQLRNTRK